MDPALVVAAIVQAIAAGIIAWFTVSLARFTAAYVRQMKRLNKLQAEANRVSRETLEQLAGSALPAFKAYSAGRSVNEGVVSAELMVRNLGGGLAFEVLVHTDWGDGAVPVPLPPDVTGAVGVAMSEKSWRDGSDPIVLGFSFRDRLGHRWEQTPGGVPRRVDR